MHNSQRPTNTTIDYLTNRGACTQTKKLNVGIAKCIVNVLKRFLQNPFITIVTSHPEYHANMAKQEDARTLSILHAETYEQPQIKPSISFVIG